MSRNEASRADEETYEGGHGRSPIGGPTVIKMWQ